MNIMTRTVEDTRVLEVRLSGRVDAASIGSLLSDPERQDDHSPSRWLVDTSGAQVDFDSEELASLATRMVKHCPGARGYRVHVVALDRVNYGCMRMLAAHLASTRVKIEVYSDADTARLELLAA